ncbi:hypothetical protein B0H13DRAFT_2390000 [Mycena leptocephala]|nr:hypothetical protein B0H13DRAFT_2390000 [Mycena leptocephala]
MVSQIIIKQIERNKRKHITSVFGLEAFGVDLKKGLEEIVISGDEMIENEVGVLKGIPADNVKLVEEKKGAD